MFTSIARFETRYQLRNPAFWAAVVLFFLLTFVIMTVDGAHIGSGGNVHINSPVAVVQIQIVMSLCFMFVTAAFVANVVVRDDESKFSGIVRSTRVDKVAYLLGRFSGAFLGACIAFLVVPLAIWLGSLMPWLDPASVGASHIGDQLFAYFLLALPNLFLTSAIFFAVACATRSVTYSYVGVVLFLFLYIALVNLADSRPELSAVMGYLDPFGGRAIDAAVRYATAVESNTRTPPLTVALLVNRLVWVLLAVGVVSLAIMRFRFAERGLSGGTSKREQARERRLAAVQPILVERLPDPTTARQAAWSRLMTCTGFELGLLFRGAAFWVLLLVIIGNTIAALMLGGRSYGVPVWPRTFAVIGGVQDSLSFLPIIVAIYYAGEAVWRDRERRIHEIIDATSLPNWGFSVPKTVAVGAVLVALIAVSTMASAMLYQISKGVPVDPLKWLAWFLAPYGIYLIHIAVLAVFVQALCPNKFVGWAVMIVYLVATTSAGALGFEHPLYTYAATGRVLLSDMNGALGGTAAWWLRLYWSAVALILAVLAHLLWRRGTNLASARRWHILAARLRGGAGGLLAIAAIVSVATGVFLFYNMDVLNTYRPARDKELALANYERKYLAYAALPQPTLVAVNYDVSLYPAERKMAVAGSYRFVNSTAAPIDTLHVRLFDFENTRLTSLSVPGARLVMNDSVFQYSIYRFDSALLPGQTGTLTFRTSRQQRGLRATGNDTRLLANGTFLNNFEFAPLIGMSRAGLLEGRALRRKYGLAPDLPPPKLEDVSADQKNYMGADWVRSEITLSTDADQTPVAPGVRVSDVTARGRRTARFVSSTPILAFFSIQSARYSIRTADSNGVRLEVYYDPHHAVNVDRMLRAESYALDYFRANFGPYQFNYARIVEFPGYETYAQAFAGTIPYSEKLGFIMDVRDPAQVDFVTYATAHELAHQYWAHQLVPADKQGATSLTETLAQYSALMVMKHLHGEEQIRPFLKFELDEYLSGRRSEKNAELPLVRVENQPYIHYRKGSVALYLLQDRLGETRINSMLRQLLDRYRFKGAPYAQSSELMDGFASLARTPEERQLVMDLFDRITLYDLKATHTSLRRLPDGTYETLLTVVAGKYYADGAGAERAAALDNMIDVGTFTAKPGSGEFSARNVISMERRPIHSGTQTLRIVTARKPEYAGIDPYSKYIDRNSDDNSIAVTATN